MLLNSSRNCVKGSDAGGRQARALSQNLPIVPQYFIRQARRDVDNPLTSSDDPAKRGEERNAKPETAGHRVAEGVGLEPTSPFGQRFSRPSACQLA